MAPAGWWRRLIAWFLDLLLLSAILWIGGGFFFDHAAALGPDGRFVGLGIALLYLILGNGPLGNGATVGKLCLGIRTRVQRGIRPGFLASALRALALLGPSFAFTQPDVPTHLQLGGIVGFGLATGFLVFFHPAGRALHDWLGQTVVVRAGSPVDVPRIRIPQAAGAACLLLACGVATTQIPDLRVLGENDPDLMILSERIFEETDASGVALYHGAHRFAVADAPSLRARLLNVRVVLPERPDSFEAVIDRVAEALLLDFPRVRALDVLTIQVAYGFDLYLAQRFEHAALTGTPAEWQTRIDPEPTPAPLRYAIDAEFQQLLDLAERGDTQAMTLVGLRYLEAASPEEYAEGLAWLDLAAQAGAVNAQYALAKAIRNGAYPGTSTEDAFLWMKKAAEQGLADAQFELGQMLEYGIGTEPDLNAAIAWHRRAAALGHPRAISELGTFLAHGKGFIPDRRESARLYEQAAEAGDAIAQFNLGIRLINGDGVPLDPGRGVYWLYRSGMQGNGKAQYWLAMMYQQGRGVGQDPELALRWFERAGRAGELDAFIAAGEMHRLGRVVPRDLAKATQWYARGSDAGDPRCAMILLDFGIMRLADVASPEIQIERIQPLVDAGDPQALGILGRSYVAGFGVERDALRGFSYVQRAAMRDSPHAQYELARLYVEGMGVRRNVQRGREWMEKAAAQNYPVAQRVLGLALYRGDLFGLDRRRGLELLKAAAASGDGQAFAALRKIEGPAKKYPEGRGPLR